MENSINQAYGKFIGTITLPEEGLVLAASEETKFPWKWLIIGGLAIALVICITSK